MFTISVETSFNARHSMTLADGSKERAHNHNWGLCAEIRGERLDDTGVIMDFGRLKAMLDAIAGEFDNRAVDEIDYFRQNNSSAEAIAKYIYERLEPELPEGVSLQAVSVVEEPGCRARFSRAG